jgi:hypothetical protein
LGDALKMPGRVGHDVIGRRAADHDLHTIQLGPCEPSWRDLDGAALRDADLTGADLTDLALVRFWPVEAVPSHRFDQGGVQSAACCDIFCSEEVS